MPYWQNVFHDFVSLPEDEYSSVFDLWIKFCDTFHDGQNVTQSDLYDLWVGFSGLAPLTARTAEASALVDFARILDAVVAAWRVLLGSLCACGTLLAALAVGVVAWSARHVFHAYRSYRLAESSVI